MGRWVGLVDKLLAFLQSKTSEGADGFDDGEFVDDIFGHSAAESVLMLVEGFADNAALLGW